MNTGSGKGWAIVHIENSYASGRKKRPRGPRPIQEVSLELISNPDTVLHRPLIDLKTKAVLYFSHNHLQASKGTLSILKGITTDVLPLRESMVESPILDLALSSVALAVYASTQQHTPAAMEGSAKYQQLLRMQQTAIQSLDENNVDVCLIAIFFMSRFEDAVHSPNYLYINPTGKLHSFSHHDGALAILKYWKDYMSRTCPATDIIKYTRRGMIRSATLRNIGLPQWLWDGSSFGECDVSELGYDSIAVRLVNLRYRLSILLKNNTIPWRDSYDSTSRFEQLAIETRNIDKELQDWAFHNLSTYKHEEHVIPGSHLWPTKYFYSSIVYSYSSPVYASAWALYYATRILIYSTLLRSVQENGTEPNTTAQDQRSEYLSVMKTTADDLASSIPFALQMLRVAEDEEYLTEPSPIIMNTDDNLKPYIANLVVWPLSMVANISGLGVEQKSWFKSLIAQLGRITGISILQCPEQWPEL